jgi:hypothetical protein
MIPTPGFKATTGKLSSSEDLVEMHLLAEY